MVVASVFAWACWPVEHEGEISIIYAGVAPREPKRVVFTITNSSGNTLRYLTAWTTERFSGEPDVFSLSPRSTPAVAGHSSTNCEREIWFDRRWTLYAMYGKDGPDPFLYRIRISVGSWLIKRRWSGLGRKILPPSRLRFAYGPEMLGSQPAASVQK